MAAVASRVEVRRSWDRPVTELSWLLSRHSFSFGAHYEPSNVHFGQLLASNDAIVQAGPGFETHAHRDLEIITWVLEGALVHQDSEGNSDVVYPGLVQGVSAGTGIRHSERSDSARSVRFVQMWVRPDDRGGRPTYQQLDVDAELATAELIPVASGMPKYQNTAPIRFRNTHAAFLAARMGEGEAVDLPNARFVHVYVARGGVEIEGAETLGCGDAARCVDSGARRLTATASSEVLVWEMDAALSRELPRGQAHS